jgi:excisionase family DNA binding protein
MTERIEENLLWPHEVADIFRVNKRTIHRWNAAGKIEAEKTPGGYRRYRESVVLALLQAGTDEATR